MSEMVAVSGAAGFIGSAVVRRLLEAGRKVRVLLEPGASTQNLQDIADSQVERVDLDVCDYNAMVAALDGCAVFYHLAAIYKIWTLDPRSMYRVNLEGTTTALLAAQTTKVKRVIYTSSIAAVGLRGDGTPSDESMEWNLQDIADEYILTKFLSERIALRFAEAGLPVVVVNPAFPFGARDVGPTPTGDLILSLLRGQIPALTGGGFNAIDVENVAAGHLAAETKGRIGQRYILGDHNITYRDFADLVCEVAGIQAPKLSLPNWLAQGVGLAMERWADNVSKREPKATYNGIRYFQRFAYFDASKARQELGLPSTPLRDSVERAIRYFRETNRVT